MPATATSPQPRRVVFNNDGTIAYVSHGEDNKITVIDTGRQAVTGTLFLVAPAIGLALSPDGTRLYAAQVQANAIQALDAATSFELGTISVGTAPDALIVLRR